MAKENLRHGDPIQIEYAPEPAHLAGDARFSDSLRKHILSLVDSGSQAKARGDRETYALILEELNRCQAETNTTSRLEVMGLQQKPYGTTTIEDNVATIGAAKPRLIVHRSHKGDRIELDGTKYPVTDKWADAFDEMLKANGAGVGLTGIVGKTTRAIDQLPAELQAILHSLPGNKGYVLRLK